MSNIKITAEYKGHPVLMGDHKDFRFNEKHLKNNLELMEAAVDRHNKILSYRLDIRMPTDEDKAKVKKEPKKFIKDFMSSYTNKLARMRLDPNYVVKMEQKTSEHPHFHAQILINGNKKLDHEDLAVMGTRLMEEQLGMAPGAAEGLIQYGKAKPKPKEEEQKQDIDQDIENNKQNRKKKFPRKYMLRRGSARFQEKFDACFKQMSYLAKDDEDDVIPSDTRKVFYSRYKRKKCRSSK